MDIIERLRRYANEMSPSGLGGGGYALSSSKAPLLREAADALAAMREALEGTLIVIDSVAPNQRAEMQKGFAMWRERIVAALSAGQRE